MGNPAQTEPQTDPLALPPYVLHWGTPTSPLPIRPVLAQPGTPQPTVGLTLPPWIDTGPVDQPFDFCAAIRNLCTDIVARCDELSHIVVPQILFTFTQARNGRQHGLQARVTPLRLRNGVLCRRYRGVAYRVQRYFVDGQEALYVMSFCLPRFLNLPWHEKFITLFHELYHISPQFNGDLRSLGGRYAYHSRSQREYDRRMALLVRAYLATRPPASIYAFMGLNFAQLQHRHGSVVGVVVPRPKLIPQRV
jgi:hypothetical protein